MGRIWKSSLLLFCFSLSCGVTSGVKEKVTTGKKMHIGRFKLEVPDAWTLFDRTQESSQVNLSDGVLKNNGSEILPPKEMNYLLSKVKKNHIVIEKKSLSEFKAVIYTRQEVLEKSRDIYAYLGDFPNGLYLHTLYQAGKESEAEKLLTLTAQIYRPGSRTGFCLENGSLESKPSRFEKTNVSVTTTSPTDHSKVYLSFNSTPASAQSEVPIPGFFIRIGMWWSFGLKTWLYRNTSRTVAGFKGREMIMEMNDTKAEKSSVLFRFYSAGEVGNILNPQINVEMETKTEDRETFTKSWDTFLDSIEKGESVAL